MSSKEYMAEYMKARYHRRRNDVLKILGGVCVKCRSTENLEIDHTDPTEKSFSISKALAGWSWSRIESEIQKCQILCKTCHADKTRKDLSKKFNQREKWEHGTLGGYRHCKCKKCKTAKSEYSKEYYKRKKHKPL